jgi:hypothetical protein
MLAVVLAVVLLLIRAEDHMQELLILNLVVGE